MFIVNLGGEGEVSGALNQQPLWFVLSKSVVNQQHVARLIGDGHNYLFCPNDAVALPDGAVALPDGSADVVHTYNVPLDVTTWRGPGVQTSEIRRILKRGGVWIHNGQIRWTKP